MTQTFDDAVVGAGILGLAHAYALAKRGRRVIVFERQPCAQGASVRNFGMLWPVGLWAGEWHQRALLSRDIWLEVLQASGLWHDRCGSLHLAYHEDETAVLDEFIQAAPAAGYACEWLSPFQTLLQAPLVNPAGLRGALWSPTEVCVDPRQVLAELPGWLHREYQVQFAFETVVTAYDQPSVSAGGREWRAENLYVCAGEDFQTLFPATFAQSGMTRVKLQMLRTQAYDESVRLGPLLAAGLTLGHYPAFEPCPSLPALKERFARELPDYVRYGIHVMAAQHARGEITLGDSHEYGAEITPFNKETIDELILAYLRGFLLLPDLRISERWQGIYAKHPTEVVYVGRPAPGVTIIGSPSGRGMTLSFGTAEWIVGQVLG
jgi:FAD dependent oxidoreductase TIGR03364